MDDVSVIQALLAGKAKVTLWSATFAGFDGRWLLCDISNGDQFGRVPTQNTATYRPRVGDQVFVLAIDGKFYMLGPTVSPPAQGTVTAVGSSNTVTVATDIGDVVASVSIGTTLSAGQVVKLFWSDGAHVLGALTAAPTPVAPPPPPESGKTQHIDVFTAVDAGSFSGGRWWQPQPWASDSTLGGWFYGTKVVDTLRAADVKKIELFASVAQRLYAPPNIGTHPHGAKPAGAPTVQSAVPIDVADGQWVTLPLAFGKYLATTVGGVGLAHGGFNKFRSLAADAQSGALRITSIY